ncbi:MAG: hypothetical protein KJ824_08010, partial [Alphaproteobacteria bacterium]|nr:hypothetical protein [Alphaproteobacteria bacterium]
MIELYGVSHDAVIKSAVGQASTNYRFALDKIFPLIDKFQEQRKVQRKKFYERLRGDILKGCQMPPITLAFVDEAMASSLDSKALSEFINNNIAQGYVLDGMQRLNTLGSGPIDVMRSICSRLCEETGYERPLLADGRADGAAAAA